MSVPAIDLAVHVRPGDGVWWGQAGAEPTPLVDALLDQADAIGGARAFSGLTWNPRLGRDVPQSLTVSSYGGLGELRRLSKAGRLEVVPCHYSALPRMFAEGRLPCDVGLVQVLVLSECFSWCMDGHLLALPAFTLLLLTID